MKISNEKLLALLGLLFAFGIMLFSVIVSDHLKSTRLQLTKFYGEKMDSCYVERISTLQYSGRGTYNVFYTNCSASYYPIFIDSGDEKIIKPGVSVSKDANSLVLRVFDNNQVSDLKLRHPDTEDDRWFFLKIVLTFMAIVLTGFMLIPSSRFEKK